MSFLGLKIVMSLFQESLDHSQKWIILTENYTPAIMNSIE